MKKQETLEEDLSLSIIKEYFYYTNLHKKTYGEKTVVFMQVGAFYEIAADLSVISQHYYVIFSMGTIKPNFVMRRITVTRSVLSLSTKNSIILTPPMPVCLKYL